MDHQLEKATRQHTKDHNLRLVLRAIYEYNEVSRAGLARLTGLTRTTISDVVADLIERGLVHEVGHGAVGVGRTPVLLSVVDDARLVAAISVTNEEIHGALVNVRGGIQARQRLPLPDRDGKAVLEAIYALADQLVRGAGRAPLGMGINTPGLIDTASGVVLRTVTFDWEELPLRALLQDRYGLPVYVANDSHSLALAEQMFGQSQGLPNLVVVKVGRGIGAGIILGGHLFAGDGYGAGEIGHMAVAPSGARCKCGNNGCLETVASSAVILDRARALAVADPNSGLARYANSPDTITMLDLAAAAEFGDEEAARLIAEAGDYLAIAVANLVSVINVRRIVITGRIAPLGAMLQEAIVAGVARRVLPAIARSTEIVVTAMSDDAPLLGAATPLLTYELGLSRLQRRPE